MLQLNYGCFINVFNTGNIHCYVSQLVILNTENYLRDFQRVPNQVTELQRCERQLLSSETDFYTNSETNLEVIKINLRTLIGSSLLHERKQSRQFVFKAD